MKIEEIKENLSKILTNSTIYINESMKKHTSFKIGGNADVFIKIGSIEDLKKVKCFANKNNIPVTIMGNGSNILVKDNGIRGIVLKIALNEIKIQENRNTNDDEVIVNVQSGVKLGELSGILQKNSVQGFEFASGIPGTIGGAIRMNAGAYGKELKDIVDTIIFMDKDLKLKEIKNEDALFTYRNSRFVDSCDIILEVKLKLKKGNYEEINSIINEYRNKRKEKQPMDKPSAGSTFKRGTDFITAELIDKAGLKGYKIGGAEVSTKHAGFIVNDGNATAKDVLDLIEYVKDKIYKEFGKKIELEVEVLGE